MKISFTRQALACEKASQHEGWEGSLLQDELAEAAKILQDLADGKFVSDGEFRVPNPIWDDITKPCPRCGIKFIITAGGGYGGGKESVRKS